MPSTYTTNLGIEKIGTGEQSGTWGTTTNTNFDLIDQGVNGVVQVTLASAGTSGSPNDLPINNGATSDGRNKFIEFVDGGDLGATAYVQLTPNDADKVAFFRNSLTGGRSVIIFQGTYNASNDFEIPSGADVVLKFDGAGAGATVTQVFEDLTISAVTLSSGVTASSILDEDNMASDSDTALATQQSIKAYVDSQVGTVDTLAEILANGNTSGATDLVIDSGQVLTTNTINETTAASGVTIDSVLLKDDGVNATNLEITNLKANDGTSAGSIADSTGVVTLASSVLTTTDINAGTIDGTVIGGSSAAAGTFTTGQFNTSLNVDGTVTADGLTVDSTLATINSSGPNVDLVLSESNTNTDARIRNSNGILEIDADLNNEFGSSSIMFAVDGTDKLKIDNNGDISFYDSSGTSQSLYWDASAESLGIGTSSPATALDVVGTVTADGLTVDKTATISTSDYYAASTFSGVLKGAATNTKAALLLNSVSSSGQNAFASIHSEPVADFRASLIGTYSADGSGAGYFAINQFLPASSATQERMRIDSSGNVGIGASSLTGGNTILNLSRTGSGVGCNMQFANTHNSAFYVGLAGNTSGDAILHSADGTAGMAFGTGNTERMRIDSSGNVLVGLTSTAGIATGATADNGVYIDGSVGAVVAQSSANKNLYLSKATGFSDPDFISFQVAGASVGSIGTRASLLKIGTGDVGLLFNSTGDAILPENIDGGAGRDAAIDLGVSGARFKDLYLSGGVYLGGTGSANLLDDYEEGTFTPTLSFGGASVGITYSNQYGRYTKVGRQVTVQVGIYLTSKGTSTGGAVVSGLPFNVTVQAGGFSSYAGTFQGAGMASLSNATNVIASENTTTLLLEENNASGASALTNANFNDATYFMATVTYFN